MSKIYIDETRGSAYRKLEGTNEIEFAPLRMDDTFDFEEEGGIVELWSEDGAEEAKKEEARIRAKLG